MINNYFMSLAKAVSFAIESAINEILAMSLEYVAVAMGDSFVIMNFIAAVTVSISLFEQFTP